ncbi:MAG: DUF4062 domain-containing protein [Planctomycetota bacterium]
MSDPDKLYRVFVSSTYLDLREHRRAVIEAILRLGMVPSGMEHFPASGKDKWSMMKSVIDQCDYYVVIVAGRYGTRGPEGQSYTEMEYRYALEKGIPVLGFVHSDIDSLPAKDTDPENRELLDRFIDLVEEKNVRPWSRKEDLPGEVAPSLSRAKSEQPRPGWVRPGRPPEVDAEVARLQDRVQEIEAQLKLATAPIVDGRISGGDDETTIQYQVRIQRKGSSWADTVRSEVLDRKARATWDDLFRTLAPYMPTPATASSLRAALSSLLERRDRSGGNVFVGLSEVHRVRVQLQALGLVEAVEAKNGARFRLTPLGNRELMRLGPETT